MFEYENQEWRDESMKYKPVYVVVECSAETAGEQVDRIVEGVEMLIDTIRADPYHKAHTIFSLIAFGSTAEQLLPMTPVMYVQEDAQNLIEQIKAFAKTQTASQPRPVTAFQIIEASRTTELVPSGIEGYWRDERPLVFFFSSGQLTAEDESVLSQVAIDDDYERMTLILTNEEEDKEPWLTAAKWRELLKWKEERVRAYRLGEFDERKVRSRFYWEDRVFIPRTYPENRSYTVYLLLDASAHMAGAPMEAALKTSEAILDHLRASGYYACVITFGANARLAAHLNNANETNLLPPVPEGPARLGSALEMMEFIRDTEDTRRVVILITAAKPENTDWLVKLGRMNKERDYAHFIGICASADPKPRTPQLDYRYRMLNAICGSSKPGFGRVYHIDEFSEEDLEGFVPSAPNAGRDGLDEDFDYEVPDPPFLFNDDDD